MNIENFIIVEDSAIVGIGVVMWEFTKVSHGARIGDYTKIGRNVFIDRDVTVGERCKIQNNAVLYSAAEIGNEVFIGPGVMLLNDKNPRACSYGMLHTEWVKESVIIKHRASVGAGTVVLPGVTIGVGAIIGAGSVVVRDVPDGAKWIGTGYSA